MIVVDTSALLAIVLDEPAADACQAALEADTDVVISAATLAEALIVAARRGVEARLAILVEDLEVEVTPVTATTARAVADAHATWGRGAGTAGLNFGDCFAYQAAKSRDCPLLFVGNDFAKTDVVRAI